MMFLQSSDTQPSLTVEVRRGADDAVVVAAAGEIDRDSSDVLQGAVRDVTLREQPTLVALDLSEVTFADSAGVRALLTCWRDAQRVGARLEISAAHQHVRQVLEIMGLIDVFHLPQPR